MDGLTEEISRLARSLVAAKEILYHGTKLKHLRSVLKKGLIPDAPEQAWAEDEAERSDRLSRISYYGTYLTTNFMTAKQSTPRMEGMIIAAQVETKTMIPDEDDMISGLNRGIAVGVMKGRTTNNLNAVGVWADIRQGKRSDEVSKAADKIIDYWLGDVKNRKVVAHLRKKTKPLIEGLVRDFFERKVAWIKKEEGDYGIRRLLDRNGADDDLTTDDVMDVSEARKKFRSTFDKVMRKLGVMVEEANDRFMYKARTVEPITYRGANRILAIMTFDETGDVTVLDFPYGEGTTAAKKMIAEWERVKGDDWVRPGEMKKVASWNERDLASYILDQVRSVVSKRKGFDHKAANFYHNDYDEQLKFMNKFVFPLYEKMGSPEPYTDEFMDFLKEVFGSKNRWKWPK